MRILWNVIKTLIFIPGVICWGLIIKDLVDDEEPEPIVRPVMFSKQRQGLDIYRGSFGPLFSFEQLFAKFTDPLIAKEDYIMDTIWTLMTWIVYGFELFGLGLLLIGAMIAIVNPGHIKWIDKIRNYILMLDEEDF